jgi:predicted ATPase/DNA-binding CsgD family transcriptional regulator
VDAGLGNLPAQVSAFIGRESELAAVRSLVAGARLVTLTGAGGVGKTRLALEAAAGLLDGSGDGVWFTDLAPVGNPDLVAVTAADVLGVRLEPGRPVLEAIVAVVGDRSLLLILDNCEHVIDACAKLADALLRGCPNLALLATSREPFGIAGEWVYRVPSMRVPAEDADVAAVRASESVRLLADRAAAQGVPLAWDEPSVALAGRICRRLDGIPLAIELAAARLRVLPGAELEARLGERFALLTGGSRAALPRHQTLRAMVDWSWELLTATEQTVLARLSVFAGGFGLAAAEAVVAAEPDVLAAEVPEHLGSLVDKSLVQFERSTAGSGRYRLLETVRQYAAGRLEALGPETADAARLAHRDYYLALAEEAAPHLVGHGQAEWLGRLDAELGNLRAAVGASLAQADPEPGLRLATSLQWYWIIRGLASGEARVLRALLDAPAAREATLTRARALAAAANLIRVTDGSTTFADYCAEALLIAREAGDEDLVARVLYLSGWLLARQRRPGAALSLVEEGLGLARRLGEDYLAARLLTVRAFVMVHEGDVSGAARDEGEALRLARQAGDYIHAGNCLGNLGEFGMIAGDVDSARRHFAEALNIARTFGDRTSITVQAVNLGLAEYLGGSAEAAVALFTESLDLARRTGVRRHAARALLGLAAAVRGGADPGWSARLHGAAGQILEDLSLALEPVEARLAAQDRERLRAAMGNGAFEAEYAAGRTLDAAQVLAELRRMGTVAGPSRAPAAAGQVRAAALAPEPAVGPDPDVTVLTPREREVLRLVGQGLSNLDIAQRLVLSEHTVHRHLANILRKLGVSSRAAAAAWGVRAGLG